MADNVVDVTPFILGLDALDAPYLARVAVLRPPPIAPPKPSCNVVTCATVREPVIARVEGLRWGGVEVERHFRRWRQCGWLRGWQWW